MQKINPIDVCYELVEWKTLPGVSRPLPRICENVPSEQKLSLYEVHSNLGKFILAELALKAQTTSMLSFLVDSVVEPCTKKEPPFGIGIDLPDGHHFTVGQILSRSEKKSELFF
jgi:hypothetical protein